MVDIENYVIDRVTTGIADSWPDAEVKGEYVDNPGTFPCVCVTLDDSQVYERSLDGSLTPHHVTDFFTVQVFSNKKGLKKSEAKALMADVDEIMCAMKMTRTMCSPTPNIDRSIYRITARYRVVHDEGRDVDGVTVVHLYRE